MNALDNLPIDRSQQPLTWGNRVASLGLILLVWLVVRLVSELHPRLWTYAFWGMAVTFAAWSATAGYIVAAFAKNKKDQTWYRWFAFWPIPITWIVFFLFGKTQSNSTNSTKVDGTFVFIFFQILVLVICHCVYYYRRHKEV